MKIAPAGGALDDDDELDLEDEEEEDEDEDNIPTNEEEQAGDDGPLSILHSVQLKGSSSSFSTKSLESSGTFQLQQMISSAPLFL